MEKALDASTHIDKIRTAKFVTPTIISNLPEITAKDGSMNTVLGLLAKGDINCAGQEIDPNQDLFAQKQPQPAATLDQRKARQPGETPAGVVRTADEVKRAEELARQKREEEERIAREEAEEKAREEARIKKENSFWNKAFKGLKEFGKKMVEEEE
jgi:cell division protein FtsA